MFDGDDQENWTDILYKWRTKNHIVDNDDTSFCGSDKRMSLECMF